jgi:hypothetical protein
MVTIWLSERPTYCFNYSVIPVKTGIQDKENKIWIPASAGMTTWK